jgi:hypothetical protein
MATLTFEPLIAPALWLTLALAGAALLAVYGWRRPGAVTRRRWAGAVALMGLGQALVLGILLNPTWVEPVTPPAGKPLLTVVVDATASMAAPDAAGGATRYQAALGLARSLAEASAARFEVRVQTFAGSVTPAEVADLAARAPQGQVTDLAAAVTGSLQEDRPQGQGLVLLSDGIHNAGGGTARVLDAARAARALACPVFTRTFGGDHEVKDLAVELRSPQELAYVGQKVPIPVLVRQHGLSGARATLALRHDAEEVERRQVLIPPSETTEVRFELQRNKVGLYRYEVRAEPLPGEVSLVNNTAPLLLRVVDQPIRVLLLEGKPYWDNKFLMRTLSADPSVELDCLVRMSASRLYRRTLSRSLGREPAAKDPPAPAVRESWQVLPGPSEVLAKGDGFRAYQVIVLGRDAEVFLTEPVLGQLRAWLLRDGGCLVCYRGQPMSQVGQRLGQLLPVSWAPARESRFRPSLTERGRDLRWFPGQGADPTAEAFAGLPTLATAARPDQPRPLAVVLATANAPAPGADSPVVTYQPYGSGRVVTIEGSGMWRWAFLPPEHKAPDEVYRSLWHSLLRWLASSATLLPGQKLALRSDRVSFGTGEPATATLVLRDEAAGAQVPAVELQGDALDKPRTVTPVPLGDEPGVFRVAFGALPEGRYQARVAGSAATDAAGGTAFDVRRFADEQLDLKARPDLMARIARESGGAVLESGTPEEIISRFREYLERDRPQRVRRLSAWDRWWVLLGVFGVWAAAWAVRRSGGLV